MNDPLKPLFSALMPALNGLARRAEETRTLAARVQSELAEELRPHVIGAARQGADLVVIVDSAAWSARIRYAGRRLKTRLEAAGEPEIGRVRVKVRGGR